MADVRSEDRGHSLALDLTEDGASDSFERRPGRAAIPLPTSPGSRRAVAAAACVAVIATTVVAMTLATRGASAPQPARFVPTARQAAAMAFDSSAGLTVMYGGTDAAGRDLYDTWLWDGTAWSPLHATDAPALSAPALADDPGEGGVLLVGTAMDHAGASQTWIFRGGAWHLLMTGGDGPRPPVTMATVPATSTVVGVADTTVPNCTGTTCSSSVVSTWYWRDDHWVSDTQVLDLFSLLLLVPSTNGGRLELVSVVAPPIPSCIDGDGACPVTSFPPHWWHWAAGSWVADTPTGNDPAGQSRLVAGAGTRSVLVVPNGQSWVLSGGRWVQLPDSGPGTPRYHGALAMDRNGAWVLFGGTTPTGGAGDDTWLLSGDAWRHVAGKPPVRTGSQSSGA